MKTIELVTPTDSHYGRVRDFAQVLYDDTIRVHIHTPPEMFFAVFEGEKVYGCVGLRTEVLSEFFLNDRRYLDALAGYSPGVWVGEQSVFAVKDFPPGLFLLFAAGTAYAYHKGIKKIAFAGIDITLKVLQNLGYEITSLGETDPSTLSAAGLRVYKYWLDHCRPVSCILDTAKAPVILKNALQRFSRKATLGRTLEPCLAA